MILDGLTAMRLLFATKVIVPVADINHDILNLKLGEFGNEVCGTLTQVGVEFTDTEAIITPGIPGFDYNTDTAREEILDAISNERFDNIHVTLNTIQPDKVDVDYVDSAIYRDVADAYYDINGNDIMVIAEIYGRYCDRADIEAIIDKINIPNGEKLSIPYQTVVPKVFAADLSAKLFNSTLGSYSTSYYAGGNRGKNVARAAELINGKILDGDKDMTVKEGLCILVDGEKQKVRNWRGTRANYEMLVQNSAVSPWTRYVVIDTINGKEVITEYYGQNQVAEATGQLLPVKDIIGSISEITPQPYDRYLVGSDGQGYQIYEYVIEGDFHKWLIKPFDYRYGVRVIERGLKNYVYVNNVLKTYDDVDCGSF